MICKIKMPSENAMRNALLDKLEKQISYRN